MSGVSFSPMVTTRSHHPVEAMATVVDKIRIMVRATVIRIQVKQVMDTYMRVRQRLHEKPWLTLPMATTYNQPTTHHHHP